MAILSKGNTFATGEQVTAAKLNNLVDNATFASDAVDNSTTALDGNGKIIVKDGGISIAKLDLSEDSPTLRLTDTDTTLSDGELSSNIEFFQSDSSGSGVGASIAAHGEGSTGLLDLRFATGANSEKMRIKHGGNVGIGTEEPDEQLTVQAGTFANNQDGGIAVQLGSESGSHFKTAFKCKTDGSGNPRTAIDAPLSSTGGTTQEAISIDNAGKVGIGTIDPTSLLQVVSPNTTTAETVAAFGNQSIETGLQVITNGGSQSLEWGFNALNSRSLVFNTDQTERMKINSSGTVSIVGALSKGSGSFKIDHPIPEKKDTHHLVHSFVESPQADNIYRGKVDLVGGTATINIDTEAGMTEGTFVLLNRDIQCFSSNETGWTAVKSSVSENLLTITAQDDNCTDTISWLVIGERQDQHMYDTDWTDEEGKVIVEPIKES